MTFTSRSTEKKTQTNFLDFPKNNTILFKQFIDKIIIPTNHKYVNNLMNYKQSPFVEGA